MILFWFLIILFAAVGFIFGKTIEFSIPIDLFPYLSVMFLSLLDCFLFNLLLVQRSVSGIWRVLLRLILELSFGCFLVFFGDQGGLELELVAVIPLGAAVFFNLHKLLVGKASDPLS